MRSCSELSRHEYLSVCDEVHVHAESWCLEIATCGRQMWRESTPVKVSWTWTVLYPIFDGIVILTFPSSVFLHWYTRIIQLFGAANYMLRWGEYVSPTQVTSWIPDIKYTDSVLFVVAISPMGKQINKCHSEIRRPLVEQPTFFLFMRPQR